MALALRYAARTNIGLGSKARNEDSAYAGPELLVLCDGMGGHAAGDVASSLVVGELVHLDGESHGADDALDILEHALEEANNRLADVMEVYPDSDGMGTTCIAMLRVDTKLAVANIGDSRAYLLRGGRLTQITTDHSFVQKLLDEGRISQEEAQHHPQRSLVTRVFTGRPEDHPDLSLRELRSGDRVLICSDGLTDYVSTEVVTEILAEPGRTPGQVADALVHTALRASTRDNVTVVVADAVSPGEGTSKPQVVGAASERRGNRPLRHLSPAEKAAALTREASGVSTVDDGPVLAEEQSRPWVRTLRLAGITVAVLAVLVAGGWAAWTWSQQQYYVGEQDGMVTIYRGISQDLGPVSLSTAEQQTDLPVEELPYYYQRRVQGTLSADGQDDAERIVADLRALTAAACVPTVLLPDGSQGTEIPDDMDTVTADSLADAQRSAAASGPARELLRDSLELGGSALGGTETSTATAAPTGSEDTGPTATVVWPEGCP
ncbi:PP2C family protein-serine/threonine phosphatase [Serinicoccus marinus]|uniref:PP2C family protein-serine/threonine phosphatase n=1 Tax=Serinicoccus marinus TaxID=247333 RepID=UPI0003B53284|nr:protein phosphatase 2C domain-containing protein [Serinicoccus marinus]